MKGGGEITRIWSQGERKRAADRQTDRTVRSTDFLGISLKTGYGPGGLHSHKHRGEPAPHFKQQESSEDQRVKCTAGTGSLEQGESLKAREDKQTNKDKGQAGRAGVCPVHGE